MNIIMTWRFRIMYISYDNYRIFYYVAKYRSFTQAANALMSNQPNVTRAIKNLEGQLGCTLFERSSRGVSLTPEGIRLYSHVSVAFEHLQAGEEELACDKMLQSGIISIGVSEVALHCALLPALGKFHRLHPGVRLRVSNHSTPQALSALRNGLVDIAVVTSPTGVTPPLKKNELKMIREVAVCSSAFSNLLNRPISIHELTEYPIISLSSQTKTYEFYSAYFSSNGLTLSPDIEAATADQILPLVRNDLGIGFVPEEFLTNEPYNSNLHIIDLIEPIPQRSICLIKYSGRSLSIAAKELEHMLLEQSTIK